MSAEGDINRSRDLYVAFAFAAADLLVEVEEDGTIGFAVGAAMALAGRPARLLGGVPLTQLFIPEDAERITRALTRIDHGERVRHLLLHTPATSDIHPPKPVALAGFRHPQRPGARLVALTHASTLDTPAEAHDPITGLLGKDGFTDLARRMLNESSATAADDAYQLTMLEVPQVEKVRAEAGPLAADEFMSELGERLRACSVGGDAAGELGGNRYGLIHAPSISTEAIESTIGDLLHAFLPPPPHQAVTSTSMALDGAGISSEEAANALIYSLNAFSNSGLTLDDLTSDLKPRLSETVAQMREIKSVIDNGDFELVFQPVVDLWTGVVHHFECLLRFPGRDSPFETVTFAENVGMVGGLDLAILRRAIEFMRSPMGKHDALRFAVNLSGRSLSHIATARQLLEITRDAIDLRGRLLFELTESAEVEDLPAVNGVLQMLRRQGFPVCLDDFGAGAAAFHYLRALTVDHVKIDGSYIREISTTGDSTPFLRAIAGLCRELKVGTIAEFVENAETTNLLKLLKVRFGQGYHFGKPYSPRPAPEVPLRGWAVENLEWQNGLLICRTAL
jgi:EAL domain-containing protein (putative c-di-GMP-specific phosphodiesterase class I)/GGDEF domain-containing protein